VRIREAAPPSSSLIDRARAAHLNARIVQGLARACREVRRQARDPLALLSPLDYVLLPFAASLPPLSFDSEGFLEESEAPLQAPSTVPERKRPEATVSTTLYVWGYEPSLPELGQEGEATVAAAAFAIRSGWEVTRAGAWAMEISRPWGLQDVLHAFEPWLRQDPAVIGWGVHMRRD
jgi:hypothetical protein